MFDLKKVFLVSLFSVSVLLITACDSSRTEKQVTDPKETVERSKSTDYDTLKKTRTYKSEVPLPPDISRIKSRGKLVVAMYSMDRPPFFYLNEQKELVGLEVEMARDIAAWLGVDVEFDRNAKSFDGVVDRVVTGHADVAISKLSMTMHRTMRASFTKPYLFFNQALLINRLKLTSLKASRGGGGGSALDLLAKGRHRICVRGPSSWNEYAAGSFPDAEIVTLENIDEIIKSVIKGDNIAFLYDEFEIKKYMDNRPDLNIELQMEIISDRVDAIGMAVAPDDRHLLSWLNVYLEYDTGNLKLQELRKQYGMHLK